jgi:hypothetical protein
VGPVTDKEALQALQRGEKLNDATLLSLSRQGLIEVRDVTHFRTPTGRRDLLFVSFTEKGTEVLEEADR